jgi:O-acetyl-ADP-ribose deacetylase (regulator of RNase III)
MRPDIVEADLLDLSVDVIVNAWNRNVIPWWLLIPQGVSGAIKKRGGYAPFRELAKHGPIPLGGAVFTGAGRLPFQGIIHVAGINMFWFATARSIRRSVSSAMAIVNERAFASVAFPIIGAGSGSFNRDKALALMLDEFEGLESEAEVLVVKYKRARTSRRGAGSSQLPVDQADDEVDHSGQDDADEDAGDDGERE